MKSKIFLLVLVLITSLLFDVTAILGQSVPPFASQMPPVVTAYRFYKEVGNLTIKVPTVVEIPLVENFNRDQVVVVDKENGSVEPSFVKQEFLTNEIPLSIAVEPASRQTENMIDKKSETYTEFYLPDDGLGKVKIVLESRMPITSSALTMLLDKNVALPTYVEVRAWVNNQNQIIFSNSKMKDLVVRFPKTTSTRWQIDFTYNQPLRIADLRLVQENTSVSKMTVRFLAQPNRSYVVYLDPDRYQEVSTGEAANLASAKDVLVLPPTPSLKNPQYVIADGDGDGVPDINDNCVSVSNSDQQDLNNNGRGDLCDDFDQDGIINSKDNCPDNPNYNQKDTDADGIGDVCDQEESRVTERYPWIPWVGIIFAGLVVLVLIILTVKSGKSDTGQGVDQGQIMS